MSYCCTNYQRVEAALPLMGCSCVQLGCVLKRSGLATCEREEERVCCAVVCWNLQRKGLMFVTIFSVSHLSPHHSGERYESFTIG